MVTPTEVQAATFPIVSAGKDMMARSRTGTGKTLAFALPLIEGLVPGETGVRILVVAPTRELAAQVAGIFIQLGDCGVATLTGGGNYLDQKRSLSRGARVVVGTPGRLCDHLDQGTLDLSNCKTVVLDEADEILDLGFQDDLFKLLGALPAVHQTLLFSATLSEKIELIGRKTMRDPVRIDQSEGLEASLTLRHIVYEVTPGSKYGALVNLLHVEQPELALLFCHTKADTENVATRLAEEGFAVSFLNGDMAQDRRTKTLDMFRKRKITLLVATDVAARGLDVEGMSHVINFGIPRDAETYIHRSGRAGRAGRAGTVLNLVSPADRHKMRLIEREAKIFPERLLVPSEAQVLEKSREAYFEDLINREVLGEAHAEFAMELLEYFEPEALVATLLADLEATRGKLKTGYAVAVPAVEPKETRALRDFKVREPRPRVERVDGQEPGMRRIRIDQGKSQSIVPGYLVRLICKNAQIAGSAIGHIALFPHHSFVDLKAEVAEGAVAKLDAMTDDGGRQWTVTLV